MRDTPRLVVWILCLVKGAVCFWDILLRLVREKGHRPLIGLVKLPGCVYVKKY